MGLVDDKVAALISKAKKDPQIDRQIHDYLSYWGMLSVGVTARVLDEDLLRKLARGRLCKTWAQYSPYIEWWRRKNHHPQYMSALKDLAEKWEKTY